MNDTIYRQDAIDMFQRLAYDDWNQGASTTWSNAYSEAVDMIRELPSAHQDDRLNKIAELVNGTINHFDRDDAMDLLYQIKEVLK